MTNEEVRNDFCTFYAACFNDAAGLMRAEGYHVDHQTRQLINSTDPTDMEIFQVISFKNGESLVELAVKCKYSLEEPDRKAWFVYNTTESTVAPIVERVHQILQATVTTYRPTDLYLPAELLH